MFLGFITGLMWGLYISTILFLYACVSDPIQQREVDSSEYAELLEKVNEECAKEEDPAQSRIHRGTFFDCLPPVYINCLGWMNIYEAHYNPHTFHVNSAQTVLVRLDGKMLRISKPDRVMLKHGFHSDPTLIETEPRMISQSIVSSFHRVLLLFTRYPFITTRFNLLNPMPNSLV